MTLASPNGDAAAASTLGGTAIANNAPWRAHWTPVNPLTNGQCRIVVPPVFATVVKISVRRTKE